MRAALFFAAHGVPVLPLHTPGRHGCSCARPDCDRPGKHPRVRHGLTDASTDPLVVAGWWRRWPTANLGLRTGVVMDVADVDTDDGRRALLRLLGGRVPDGPAVRTGSGGWHLWFAPTGYGNRVGLLPGVDWRGAGGYVVAPPSRHAGGAAYTWLRRFGGPLPACPPALRELLRGPDPPPAPRVTHPQRYAQAVLDAAAERVATAVPGTRNDTLNRAAFALGRLAGAGVIDEAEARRALAAAARHCGLGRAETLRTLRSGLGAGIRQGYRPGTLAG
jgi:hypothetical protein